MSRYAAVAFVLLGLVMPSLAHAHDPALSRGDYTLSGANVSADLSFGHADFGALGRGLGFSETWNEEGEAAEMAEALLREGFDVQDGDGAACPPALDEASLDDDALAVRATFRCPGETERARVTVKLLSLLPEAHRHAAGGRMLTRGDAVLDLGSETEAAPSGFGGYFVSGIEHILFGFDHLVFLFGLVLVGRKLKGIVVAVTTFTVAHSLTLGLALVGVFSPRGDVIEPLIALSVAYVGIENFFVKDADKRWRVTLPFGLIHGFGFAGALGGIDLPPAEIPAALFAFNLGVEIGQLGVLAVILPIMLRLHRVEWLERDDRGVRSLSVAIVGVGLFWFVTRVAGI